MKKGFTLTELLIALAVLGLLIAILTPIIANLIPDQNALMAKRSYYAIQSLASDMLNNEACYPDNSQSTYKDSAGNYVYRRIGFDDGYGYADCVKWGGVENSESIATENSGDKFIVLFKNKLDVKKVGENAESSDKDALFETRDGLKWFISPDFSPNNQNKFTRIFVDVNGDEKPNCSEAHISGNQLETGENCQNRHEDFDIYSVKVYPDGKIEIEDNWAVKAVDINKDVTSSETDDD